MSALSLATTAAMTNVDPASWNEHRYGLSPERWSNLRDKSFWITGAGTGYGRCISVALASAGAQLFLTGRRRTKLLESIAEMKSLGISVEKCHIVDADITNINEMKSAFEKIASLCKSLYGLVHNAAIPSREGIRDPLQSDSPKQWERIIQTNVTAPWFLTKEMFPHMKKGGAVRVLFITSEAGWAFTQGFGPYNVSKAALNSLSSSMAEEYAASYPEHDIQINALVPGEAKTEMNNNSSQSPYTIASMTLILLSHQKGGPNGKFFHRDGRHLQFAYAAPFGKPLI